LENRAVHTEKASKEPRLFSLQHSDPVRALLGPPQEARPQMSEKGHEMKKVLAAFMTHVVIPLASAEVIDAVNRLARMR